MNTANQQAAALDAAALAVRTESELRRSIGPQRLEDVEPGRFTLSEWSDSPMTGHEGLRFWVRTHGIEVYDDRTEPRVTVAKMTAAEAVRLVLDFRAEDPQAAHERDIAAAEALIADRRNSYENACRRLSDPTHPNHAAVRRSMAAGEVDPFTEAGGALADRELFSRLLATTTAALAALRAAGPHQPPQGRLF